MQLCLKRSVHLTLHNPDEDLPVYKDEGLAALRQHRLIRITQEAIEQGALLHMKNFSVDQIRIATGYSNRLIGEYVKLYK